MRESYNPLVKTTLDIPEPIARRIGALAERSGRPVEDQILQVLYIFLASDLAGADWAAIVARTTAGETPDVVFRSQLGGGDAEAKTSPKVHPLPEPVISIDPATGLPVIYSPPDAPIHRMTAADWQKRIDDANEEDDLVRAGFPVRP